MPSFPVWQHHDQDNLYTKEFICAGGFRGLRLHHGREVWHSAAWRLELKKMRALTLNLKQEAGKKKKPLSSQNLPPVTYCFQQGNSDPPQTATNWELRIQMPEAT